MHLYRFLRIALTLLFGAAISTAFVVPKPGVSPSEAPAISKKNTDLSDRSQPPAAVTTPTIYYAREVPARARDGATRFAGRNRGIAAEEDGGGIQGTQKQHTKQAEEDKVSGTGRNHRRDVAGMATPGFVMLVVFGAIAFLAIAWYGTLYWRNNGQTAIIE